LNPPRQLTASRSSARRHRRAAGRWCPSWCTRIRVLDEFPGAPE